MTDTIHELRRFPLFERYSEQALREEVLAHLRRLTVSAGELICQERAPGDRCFLLVEGEVEVQIGLASGRQETVGHLEAGSLFGQIAMLDGGTRSASCVARRDCQLLVLERDAFDALRRSGNRFALDLLREIGLSLAAQVRQATESLSAMSESRVEDPSAISERLRVFMHGAANEGDDARSGRLIAGLKLRQVKL